MFQSRITPAKSTPADLAILPRDRRFGRDRTLARGWCGGDPFRTAVYNALSVTFPKGEALFVDSVRRFREGTPARLGAEIAAFIRQEVAHSREHLAFNRQVSAQGYDVAALDAQVDARLALLTHQPAIVSLGVTIALEHFTAILAHALLADPGLLDGADPDSARLWRWHAVEEIEHKGVAYDTWLHATRDWPRRRRWLLKAALMLRVTRHFAVDRVRGALDLLAQDGITGWRARAGLARVLLVSPGLARRLVRPWFAYFAPGFHPWNEDDRALIAAAEATLDPPAA
jgi:uncharacterized protein